MSLIRVVQLGARSLLMPLLLLVLVHQVGCAAMVRYQSPSLEEMGRGRTVKVRSLGYLWGIVPPQHISLDQCGTSGIQEMKVRQGLLDWVITYGTVGIVVSYNVKIICARGPRPGETTITTQ